ncbi:MAG: carboxypeptidase regulatory-like domain-containing protein [Acidobacteriia bacterium]|nr:carboxypeptidase regulatory-like domain-containing protein [Terriglobia bacterium]
MPNAQVVVEELGTNIAARTLATDDNGNYEAPGLKPGRYKIKVDKAGFRNYVAEDVLLDAGQTRRIDVALQVGTTAETVTVEAGAALIQTETSAISGELDKRKFLDRPLVDVYPSPLALMTTMPGIQGNGWNLVMSGVTDRNKQTWAMDGVANDTTGDQLDNPAFFETVQVNEVSTGTDMARATSFNMISKRGANDWHASAYYKHENAALNAREFFTPYKTPYILHEADADVTGPIIKNRTFFYFGWVHQAIPLGSWTNRSTPTLQMRAGDFSQFTTVAVIKDPFNGNAAFPLKQVPSNRWSSVSQKVMDLYYPKPNQGGPNTFTNNYGWYFPYNSDLYKGDWPFFRIDHNVTSKNSMYVRWMRRKTPYIRPGNGFDNAVYTQARDHRQLVASDTHVFTPTLVNIFTFGHQTDHFLYGEDEKGIVPLFGDDVVKAIGLQGVNPKGYHTMGFPRMTVNGLSTLYNSDGANNYAMNDDGANTYTETLTWNKGKHVLRFGGEIRRYWWFSGSIPAGTYGDFNFNGSITGVGFADFLLGVPYTATRLDPITNRNSHDIQAGLFIADTFKVTPNLTLDYGLRWDYYGITTYDDGLMYNFDLKTGNVVVSQAALSKVNALYPKNIPITTGQVVPNVPLHNLHPRISAAYRIGSNMVVRGGYGEYTDSWSYTARRPGASPFQLSETYNQVISSTTGPLFTLPNPFPSSLSAATVPSQGVTALPLDTKIGTVRQINFTIEREVHNLGLRLSYIGMRNSGLAYGTYNMDKPQPSTATFTQSMRPYNLFTSVNVFGDNGEVRYNSLQAEIRKRMGAFTFNSNVTWSKNLYNWANLENPYNPNQWARDGSNRDWYWVTSGTWQLPVGRQQRFLSSAPAVIDTVLGGWTAQFVSTFATPTYVSPSFSGSDPSGTNTSGGLPDAIGSPYDNFNRTITSWFNAAAFAPPPKGRFGDASPNCLQGYGIAVQHLSVAKQFRITERLRFTLTGAFSNLFNHPHFASINTNISNPNPGMFTSTRPNYEPEKQGYRQVDLKFRIEW